MSLFLDLNKLWINTCQWMQTVVCSLEILTSSKLLVFNAMDRSFIWDIVLRPIFSPLEISCKLEYRSSLAVRWTVVMWYSRLYFQTASVLSIDGIYLRIFSRSKISIKVLRSPPPPDLVCWHLPAAISWMWHVFVVVKEPINIMRAC